ncbi:hypothetical protein V502_08208 [Pseudogymnoascus sp. VKM F-4520 (FW-2644)]|nr:hypothetical protein V502_08208 [Pseudogymnoascus sp. VKM F-4520 (FW-2644)]
MKSFFATFFLATMATTSFAHMEMSDPPPLRSKHNSFVTNPEYSMTNPLSDTGSDFACKGFLTDLANGNVAGSSVATWAAGSSQSFTIEGSASHGGGSCQASLSTDAGKTFKTIHSYIGNCPLVPSYKFTVPADTPAGKAVFAWTWFNKIGNREMYMNCASVTITAGSGTPAVAFSARPDMFVANAGNGCKTLETFDLLFPDPGPDVTNDSTGTKLPTGTCPGSDGSSGGTDSNSANTGATTSAAPVSVTTPASVVAPVSPTGFTTSIVPSSSNTVQSGSTNPKTPSTPLTPSTNGECGGSQTCTGSGFGQCCSKYGYCGVTAAHCGDGCDPTLGICGGTGASGTAAASGAVVTSGAAKTTGNSFLVSNVAGTKADSSDVGSGEMVTKTETEVVYSTVYVTDKAAATGAAGAQAAVNDVGGRSTFQTVTRGT